MKQANQLLLLALILSALSGIHSAAGKASQDFELELNFDTLQLHNLAIVRLLEIQQTKKYDMLEGYGTQKAPFSIYNSEITPQFTSYLSDPEYNHSNYLKNYSMEFLARRREYKPPKHTERLDNCLMRRNNITYKNTSIVEFFETCFMRDVTLITHDDVLSKVEDKQYLGLDKLYSWLRGKVIEDLGNQFLFVVSLKNTSYEGVAWDPNLPYDLYRFHPKGENNAIFYWVDDKELLNKGKHMFWMVVQDSSDLDEKENFITKSNDLFSLKSLEFNSIQELKAKREKILEFLAKIPELFKHFADFETGNELLDLLSIEEFNTLASHIKEIKAKTYYKINEHFLSSNINSEVNFNELKIISLRIRAILRIAHGRKMNNANFSYLYLIPYQFTIITMITILVLLYKLVKKNLKELDRKLV